MRDTTQLHPDLQIKIPQLISACAAQGIIIKIGECLRTVSEQNALYAKGRTAPGCIVTNATGTKFSSMHQWGVAFDFYINMDVDGDGKISDDLYNNSTALFNKVGKIGQSIGLEWGGAWSIHDLPHFQLPNWGSTAAKLKAKYGNPDKFRASWKKVVSAPSAVDTTQNKYAITDYKHALAKSVGLPETASPDAVLDKTITLYKGCKGYGVAAIQYMFYCLGYYNGAIDGEWGKQTDACAYAYQKERVAIKKPDKVFTRRGISYKKMLDIA